MSDTVHLQGLDARLVPPGIADIRGRAVASVVARMIDTFEPEDLLVIDYEKVDAKLLPILVRGHSLEDLMFDGITEEIVRIFCANAGALHARKGGVDGVRFALDLLGFGVDWVNWNDTDPKGPHDTYEAIVYVDRNLFPGETGLINERTQRAALDMIDAMKRWSQEGGLAIGIRFKGEVKSGGAMQVVKYVRQTFVATPQSQFGTGAA